jgi:hypothetical protein
MRSFGKFPAVDPRRCRGCYGDEVTSLALVRSKLGTKGMIWSPRHGDTAITAPMFDEFMKRIVPGDARR